MTRWRQHAAAARQLHEKLFYRPLLDAVARLPDDAIRLTSQSAAERLEALGYADPAGALRHISALTTGVSRKAAIQRTLLPAMLGWFADAPRPDAGLLAFRQVSEALGRSPWYLRLLRDDTNVAWRMARLLASGRYATDLLLRAPDAVAMLADDDLLAPRQPAEPARRGRRDWCAGTRGGRPGRGGRAPARPPAPGTVPHRRRRPAGRAGLPAGGRGARHRHRRDGGGRAEPWPATRSGALRAACRPGSASSRWAGSAGTRWATRATPTSCSCTSRLPVPPSTRPRWPRTRWRRNCAACSAGQGRIRRCGSTRTCGPRAGRDRWCGRSPRTGPTTAAGLSRGRFRRCCGPTRWPATAAPARGVHRARRRGPLSRRGDRRCFR